MNKSSPSVTIAFVLVLALGAAACDAADNPSTMFSGKLALQHTKAVTDFGPRPPGTPAHDKTEKYILSCLDRLNLKPEVDQFNAVTPRGTFTMKNYVVKFPGETSKAVMIVGHYDTMPAPNFVGANDGGSSTGELLEFARVLKNSPKRKLGVWLAFVDGEEAQGGSWTDTDSLWGSRHLAEKLHNSGEYRNLAEVIVVDMIGDKDLDLIRDLNSNGWMNELVRRVATEMKLEKYFNGPTMPIEDDHMPFAKIGLPVLDLIDATYGPPSNRGLGEYWHTPQDTMDKLSANSLEVVGRVVLGSLDALGRR